MSDDSILYYWLGHVQFLCNTKSITKSKSKTRFIDIIVSIYNFYSFIFSALVIIISSLMLRSFKVVSFLVISFGGASSLYVLLSVIPF